MVISQSFLVSLPAEQNRYCAILQGSSRKQKIHSLSSVQRGSFWIPSLDSFGITLGDECCQQDRPYVGRGIIQFLFFLISFHDYTLVPTGLKKCSCIEKEPAERGSRHQQHLPSAHGASSRTVTFLRLWFQSAFFCNFSDVGQWSAVRHLMCQLLLEHARWAKLCNGVSWLKQKAEVCGF